MSFNPPIEGVNDAPSVIVELNAAWVSHLLGLLETLTKDYYWTGDDAEVLNATQKGEAILNALAKGNYVPIPVGSIISYGGDTAPDGWLVCNGANVSRVTYAKLFSAIGIRFGTGDGLTTFTLPDLRGRSPLGSGAGEGLTTRVIGEKTGEQRVTLSLGQIPQHSHSASMANIVVGSRSNASAGNLQHFMRASNTGSFLEFTIPPGAITVGNAGNNESHQNMHPVQVVNFIIRWK